MNFSFDRLKPRTLRTRRLATGAAFLAAAVLTSASIFATGPSAQPEIRTEKSWPVSVVNIKPENLSPTFSAFGRIESSNVAKIRTDLVAEVRTVHVREGDWVQAGDVLISLSDVEAHLRLQERRAELDTHRATLSSLETEKILNEKTTAHYTSMLEVAENKLNRHRDLMADRLISQSLLDEVVAQANQATIEYQNHMRMLADLPNRIAAQKAQISKAQALLSQAELDVGKTSVTAPFSGPVLSVFVAPGDRSSLGAPLIELAESEGFEIRVPVPEVYNQRFNTTSRGHIRATTASGDVLHLVRLSSQVRQGQSGVDAFFELPTTTQTAAVLGRLVDLKITMPLEPQVVALPVQSIYENDRVYEVRDSRLQSIVVERVGEYETSEGDYRVLVRSDELSEGQNIITTQLPKAISGLLVEEA